MDKIISRVFEELSNDQRKEIMKLFDAKKEAEALSKVEKIFLIMIISWKKSSKNLQKNI